MKIKNFFSEIDFLAIYYALAGGMFAMCIVLCIIGRWLGAVNDLLFIVVLLLTARQYKRSAKLVKIIIIQDRMIEMLTEKMKKESEHTDEEKKEEV